MKRDLERLHELQKAGVEMTRNRNFSLFREPANRRALALHRYLDNLAAEMRRLQANASLHVSLVDTGAPGPVDLVLESDSLRLRHVARLDRREVDELARREGIAAILRAHGVRGHQATGRLKS